MTGAALLFLAAAAAPLEHRPVACVAPDRYARITVRAAAPLAAAELELRIGV